MSRAKERPDAAPVPADRGLRRLLAYSLRHRATVAGALAATLLATGAALLVPLIQRTVVDRVVLTRELGLLPCVIALMATGVVRFAAGAGRRYLAARLSYDVQYGLRNDIFRTLSRLDGVRQDELRAGQLVSRAISDLTMVQGLLMLLPHVLAGALMFLLALGVMVVLSPALTLVMLLVLPLLLFTALHSDRRMYGAATEAQQQEAVVAGVVDASVAGVHVVKGFAQEAYETRRLEAAARRLFTARSRIVRLNGLYGATLQGLPLLGQAGVLALGGWMAARGSISVGTLVAFSAYLAEMVAPMRGLAALVTGVHQARASVARVFEVIDTRALVTEAPGAAALSPSAPATVELDDVTFGYGCGAPVLNGLTLSVTAGETLALIGPAGSGKSTVMALLTRFYDVQGGAVRVGGADVRDLTLGSLRSAFGLVPEHSFLFSGTIRENIAYGRPDAGDEEVRAAARAAGADLFVSALPGGYGTPVGERGLSLSGGQRQRLALARALLVEPRILLLDDATSQVDPHTEAEIHQALRDVTRGRTTVLVARRRSSIALADRVAVLDEGRLVDVGTHSELMARCARYRVLLAQQEEPAPAPMPTTPDPVPSPAESEPVAAGAPGDTLPSHPEARAPAGLTGAAVAPALRPEPDYGPAQLLRPFRVALAVGALLVVLDALSGVFFPLFIRGGIDDGVRQAATGTVLGMALAAGAVVVVGWGISFAQIRVNGATGERIRYFLRLRAFAHLHRLDLQYYEREAAGRTMTRLTSDVEAVASFAQTGFATAAVSVLSMLGMLVLLFSLDWPLALVACGAVPVLLLVTFLFRPASARAYDAAREQAGVVNSLLRESTEGLRLAQSFGRTGVDAARFGQHADVYRAARLRAQRLMALYFGLVEFLPEAVASCVLVIGASRVVHGAVSVGTLVVLLLYVSAFFAALLQLAQVLDGYQQSATSFRRIQELFRDPAGTSQAATPLVVERLAGHIEFHDVRFRYRGAHRDAVAGIDLTVPAGQCLAVVGATGAGKSTLVKLVARYYDATSGTVRVDGYDVCELDSTAYRKRLGVVPQESHLHEGTVGEAIAYGRPDASGTEVEAAARAVGAHDVLSRLPGGYAHPVTEGGRSLSAGERQLIALARAQLIAPDVLILDEATSALDPATEGAVSDAIGRLSAGRTALIVAHRPDTAARADRVVLVDSGRIVASGTHQELMAEERYARLWQHEARAHAPAVP
ncbi:ABC transporter ATP-binding protein [Streptomyces griseoluteus]|uniref:ABC transporter ATP-binding protein n=1 Tax=Streptomyces griseoluteus TaxID=29306 RepID=UPI0019A150B9|nr:ABC transporter ATP-binding protein [Streptomyces griseoluteus]GHE98088.1 ABC transporter ATP-binding protein [Streptomyces griseoluteus]